MTTEETLSGPLMNPTDEKLIESCHADRDGDCPWSGCPQQRDGEPVVSGRHCPLDIYEGDDE